DAVPLDECRGERVHLGCEVGKGPSFVLVDEEDGIPALSCRSDDLTERRRGVPEDRVADAPDVDLGGLESFPRRRHPCDGLVVAEHDEAQSGASAPWENTRRARAL